VAQLEQSSKTGVILKDLARTARIAARVYIRSALDPSQAQDDLNDKLKKFQIEPLLLKAQRLALLSAFCLNILVASLRTVSEISLLPDNVAQIADQQVLHEPK
jgi:hypothetical protein